MLWCLGNFMCNLVNKNVLGNANCAGASCETISGRKSNPDVLATAMNLKSRNRQAVGILNLQ